MNRASLIVAITVLLAWLAAPASEAPTVRSPIVPPPPPVLSQPAAVPHPPGLTSPLERFDDRRRDDDADASAVTDLYGNDVARALARYKVDNAGSLYELHSPHTEIPRLGIPKS